MAPKKKAVIETKLEKKKPSTAFVQPEQEFADEDDEAIQSAPEKSQRKQMVRRSPLNHATDSGTIDIEGMKFRRSRGLLDGTSKKTLDIDPAILNPELAYYWTNDEKGLVDQRVEIGYQVVPQLLSRTGEKISTRRRVGTQKDGSPLEAVLMATPKNWKKERQDAQENERQKLEQGLLKGSTDGQDSLGKGFYVHRDTEINN